MMRLGRVNARLKVVDALERYTRNENLSKNARMAEYLCALVPTLMYRNEIWIWDERYRRHVSAVMR